MTDSSERRIAPLGEAPALESYLRTHLSDALQRRLWTEKPPMTEDDLINHLTAYVLVCYPDGDASETMVVERIIDAIRALPRAEVEAALWAIDTGEPDG